MATIAPVKISSTVGSLTNGSNYDGFPGAIVNHAGDWMVIYRGNVNAHGITGNATLYKQVSDDDGSSWTGPTQLITPSASYDYRDPDIVKLSTSNHLMMSYTRVPAGGHSSSNKLYVQKSTNDGSTWASAVEITHSSDGFAIITNAPIELANGRLLAAYRSDDSSQTSYDDAEIVYSDTDGATWFSLSTIVGDTEGQDVAEPCLLLLPNGNVLCTFRNSAGSVRYSLSTNSGLTWASSVAAFTSEANPRTFIYQDRVYSSADIDQQRFEFCNLDDLTTWTRVDLQRTQYANYADFVTNSVGDLVIIWSEDPTETNNSGGTDSDFYFQTINSTREIAIADDSFDRSDRLTVGWTDGSSGSGFGLNWTESRGDMRIVSNKLQNSNTTSNGYVFCDCFWPDGVLSADIVPTTSFVGIIFRMDAKAYNNGYLLQLRPGSPQARLFRLDGGSATLLDSAVMTITAGTSYAVEITLDGDSIVATVDGGNEMSATDSTYETETIFGFNLDDVQGNTCTADNFLLMPLEAETGLIPIFAHHYRTLRTA